MSLMLARTAQNPRLMDFSIRSWSCGTVPVGCYLLPNVENVPRLLDTLKSAAEVQVCKI